MKNRTPAAVTSFWCCFVPLALGQGQTNPTPATRAEIFRSVLANDSPVCLAKDSIQLSLAADLISSVQAPGKGSEDRRSTPRLAAATKEIKRQECQRVTACRLGLSYVAVLRAKALLSASTERLNFFDRFLAFERDRFVRADISGIELNRLENERIRYEEDYVEAAQDLRDSKDEILQLLGRSEAPEQFDLTGPFDFTENPAMNLGDLRKLAVDTRPDLKLESLLLQGEFGAGLGERRLQALRGQVYLEVDRAYSRVLSSSELAKAFRSRYLLLARQGQDDIVRGYERAALSISDVLDILRNQHDMQIGYLNVIAQSMSAREAVDCAVGNYNKEP